MKVKKLMLTILSVFALLFVLTGCGGKSTWDDKERTYESPDAKLTFTRVIPLDLSGGKKAIRYSFELTNKSKVEKTVEDILKEIIKTVKQGDESVSRVHFVADDGDKKLEQKLKPGKKINARIDFEVKDEKMPMDMIFNNGDHFKQTLDEMRKRDDEDTAEEREKELSKAASTEDHAAKVAEKELARIETAPVKFDWTWKQYDELQTIWISGVKS